MGRKRAEMWIFCFLSLGWWVQFLVLCRHAYVDDLNCFSRIFLCSCEESKAESPTSVIHRIRLLFPSFSFACITIVKTPRVGICKNHGRRDRGDVMQSQLELLAPRAEEETTLYVTERLGMFPRPRKTQSGTGKRQDARLIEIGITLVEGKTSGIHFPDKGHRRSGGSATLTGHMHSLLHLTVSSTENGEIH